MTRKKMGLVALASALLAWGILTPSSALGADAVTLEVVPSVSILAPGGSADVAVVVSGLADAGSPSLGAYDLVLTFDPGVFALNGVALGPDLGTATSAPSVVVADLNVFAISLLTPVELNTQQPDLLTLFTATFEAVGVGDGAFDLMLNSPLGDEFGAPLPTPDITQAVVSAGTVPEIPTLSEWSLLLLVAILALLGARRLDFGRVAR